jgi:hypothetical protein
MAVISNQQATLTQGQTTVLHRARFEKCRLTLTGLSGEFTTIPFRTKTRGSFFDSGFFQASEVSLSLFSTIPSGTILATTPAGVATLDVVYEVRTRGDA